MEYVEKLEWFFLLLLLIGVVILASFGINHADESLIIAIISPIILGIAVIFGVTIFFAKLCVRKR